MCICYYTIQSPFQYYYHPLQVLFANHIRQSHLVFVQLGIGVKFCRRSHHDGFKVSVFSSLYLKFERHQAQNFSASSTGNFATV